MIEDIYFDLTATPQDILSFEKKVGSIGFNADFVYWHKTPFDLPNYQGQDEYSQTISLRRQANTSFGSHLVFLIYEDLPKKVSVSARHLWGVSLNDALIGKQKHAALAQFLQINEHILLDKFNEMYDLLSSRFGYYTHKINEYENEFGRGYCLLWFLNSIRIELEYRFTKKFRWIEEGPNTGSFSKQPALNFSLTVYTKQQ